MKIASATDRGSYVECCVAGDYTFNDLADMFREIHQHCVDNGFKGTLVDLTTINGAIPPLDRGELARVLAPEWGQDILIAVLFTDGQHVPGRFGEIAAQNRGVRLRAFTRRDMATGWLIGVLS